jgi:hypothetical protein
MTSPFDSPRFVRAPVQISWISYHEAGHVVAAAVLGCPIFSTRIHALGGVTSLDGDPRELLICALGGNVAERLFGVRDTDIRCSSDDYKKAFQFGLEVAREEERTAPAPVPQTGRKEGRSHDRPCVARALSAVSVSEVEAGASAVAERVAARWLARAHTLVDLAEVEVCELLSANRRALGKIAERLEENKQLDAVDIIQLAGEGRLIEREDRRNT